MTRGGPTRIDLVHDPDIVMRLALTARLYRTIRDEVEVFSVGGDIRIGVLILAGERRDFRLRPTAVLVTRNEDGPAREIRRHFEKVDLAAVGREDRVRFVVSRGNDPGRKQCRVWKRLPRIVGWRLGSKRR